MKKRDNTNPIMGNSTALNHWVYTEAGIAVSRDAGITRRQAGKPVESAEGPTKCLTSWVVKGWVREATEEEHIAWMKKTKE